MMYPRATVSDSRIQEALNATPAVLKDPKWHIGKTKRKATLNLKNA